MTLPLIQFENVNKWFGKFHVLRDINLQVRQGERIVICGPSGSGKSTLLRCINRLEAHQEGKLTVMGIELTDDLRSIESIRRQVGMVFQQFNLFPHFNVLQNLIEAPMAVRGLGRAEATEQARALLASVGLADKIGRAHV